jgi:hypothetical protein
MVVGYWLMSPALLNLPYQYSHGPRRLNGDPAPMSDDEDPTHAKLLTEYRVLEEKCEVQDNIHWPRCGCTFYISRCFDANRTF